MKILSVLKKDFGLLLKDRGLLATLFLMPLAFILPISFGVGPDGYGSDESQREPLPVLDYDGGTQALDLIESLDESLLVEQNMPLSVAEELGLHEQAACAQSGLACDELIFDALLKASDREALLIIPAGFSADVEAGNETGLVLTYDPAGDSARLQQIQGVIKGQTIKISIQHVQDESFGQLEVMSTYAPDSLQDAVEEEANKSEDPDQEPAFNMDTVYPDSYTLDVTPNTYQQTVPGYTVMFAFFIVTYISAAIREEKISGTFRRLLSMPVKQSTLLSGKLLSAFIIGVIQIIVMFAVGVILFRMDLGQDPLALALLIAAVVASATAIGLAAAAAKLSSGAMIAPLLIGALIGGCVLPIDMLPPFVRTVGMFVPHSWALNGFQNLMVRGYGLEQVMPQIGVLLLFAVAFFLFAVRRFDFDDVRS